MSSESLHNESKFLSEIKCFYRFQGEIRMQNKGCKFICFFKIILYSPLLVCASIPNTNFKNTKVRNVAEYITDVLNYI